MRRLIALLHGYLTAEVARCLANGVRVTVIGRRDRLPGAVVAAIEVIETATARAAVHLRLAVDYSGLRRDRGGRAACGGPRHGTRSLRCSS